jgi:two-component system response regulator
MTPFILIVDDRPDDIVLTEMALSVPGREIRTESVSTGEGALEFLRTAPELPAMILLDLKMPGMGGLETLRRIRADARLKDIPVVIITCSTLESDIQAARLAGATGFVHKAIRLDEFSRDMEQHVKCWIGK